MVSCARYWVALPGRAAGDHWTADLPPDHAELAGEAYVTVFDAAGRAVSGSPVARTGLDPQLTAGPLWRDGCLWDTERGADAWRPLWPGGKPRTRIAANPDGGVDLAPEAAGTGFCALTNSVVLASGHAAQHAGVRLHVAGNGMGGEVRVALVRDSTSLDELEYAAVRELGPGSSVFEVRWDDFRTTRRGATSPVWPFNGLVLEGERAGGTALTIRRVGFLD